MMTVLHVQRLTFLAESLFGWLASRPLACMSEVVLIVHSFGVISHRFNSKVLPESDAIGVVDAAGMRSAGGCVCIQAFLKHHVLNPQR